VFIIGMLILLALAVVLLAGCAIGDYRSEVPTFSSRSKIDETAVQVVLSDCPINPINWSLNNESITGYFGRCLECDGDRPDAGPGRARM
jgi:hypothetical protein